MNFLRGLGSVILSLSIILLILFIILGSSANTLLYPDVYKKAFEENQVYGLVENLTQQEERFSFIAFPEGGAKEVVDELIEESLKFVRSEIKEVNVGVELNTDEFKDLFEDKTGESVTGEEVNGFLDDLAKGNNLSAVNNGSINFGEMLGLKEDNGNEDLLRLREFIKIYTTAFYAAFAVLAVLVFLLFLLRSRRARSYFKWIGTNALLAGAIALSASFAVAAYAGDMITLAGTGEEHLPDALLSAGQYLLDAVISKISVISYIMIILGMVLIISSFFFKKEETND